MHYFPADPPPLSTSFATLLTVFFTVSFVGSLYLLQAARLSFMARQAAGEDPTKARARVKFAGERWRDDPDVIRARLLVSAASTLMSCGVVWWIIGDAARKDPGFTALDASSHTPIWRDTLWRLGLLYAAPSPHHSPPSQHKNWDFTKGILPLLVTPTLYLGPLYCLHLQRALPFQESSDLRAGLMAMFGTWVGFRNWVHGPITEEIVWRGCILSICHLSGTSKLAMIFLTPLSFGLAHIHHGWDTYNRYGRTTAGLRIALGGTLFQLTYTTLFGAHCAFLFLRTGSLLPPISAHVFCNVMGVPQLAWELRMFPARKRVIVGMYIAGIVGYAWGMRMWTRDGESVYWDAPNGFL